MRRIPCAILVVLACLPALGQDSDPIITGKESVAVVGGRSISVDEFVKRHDFAPWPGADKRGATARSKMEVIHSLIAEKLLALDARSLGIHEDPSILALVDELERLLVLDALYRIEIVDNATVTDMDVLHAVPLFQSELDFDYVSFDERTQADGILREARARGGLRSSAREYSRPVESLTIRLADLKPEISGAVLDSFAVGHIYGPTLMEGAWYLFELMDFREEIVADPRDVQALRWRVRNELRQRREEAAFNEFIETFSAGKQAEIDGGLYSMLHAEIENVIEMADARLAEHGETKEFPVVLSRRSFEWIRARLADRSDAPMLIFDGFTRPLGYVLDRMAAKEFVLRDESHSVRSALNTMLRRLIEEEFLIQEGYARRLHERSDIAEEVDIWLDAYLAEAVARRFEQQHPGDDDREPVWEVNIREILVTDRPLADSLFVLIETGSDMAPLAAVHSERHWAADQGGEWGYFLTDDYGVIGQRAAEMEIGEIAGPLETEDGFSVFRLLDKRRPLYDPRIPSISERVDSTLNAHVARLAQEYEYAIDFEMLNRIEVAPYNQMVIRSLGFNNRMPGAPTLRKRMMWLDMIDRTTTRVGL